MGAYCRVMHQQGSESSASALKASVSRATRGLLNKLGRSRVGNTRAAGSTAGSGIIIGSTTGSSVRGVGMSRMGPQVRGRVAWRVEALHRPSAWFMTVIGGMVRVCC